MTTTLNAAELRQRVETALSEITLAESALEIALRDLGGGPRAEKVTTTAVVTEAFTRLHTARTELVRLKDVLSGD